MTQKNQIHADYFLKTSAEILFISVICVPLLKFRPELLTGGSGLAFSQFRRTLTTSWHATTGKSPCSPAPAPERDGPMGTGSHTSSFRRVGPRARRAV